MTISAGHVWNKISDIVDKSIHVHLVFIHIYIVIYVSTYIYYLFLCTHTKQQKLHNDDDSSAYLLSQVVLLESNDQRDHMAPAGIATAHDAIASGIPTVLLPAVSGWWPKGLMLVAQIVGKSSIGHALI